jgi:hypothetical protein
VTGGVIPFLGHEALYGVGLGGVAVGYAGYCCNAGGGVPYGRSHNGEVLPVVGASVGVVLVVGGNIGIERPLKPITQFYWTGAMRTSENSVQAKVAEFIFYAVR